MNFKNTLFVVAVFNLGVFSSDWLKSTGRYLFFGSHDNTQSSYQERQRGLLSAFRNGNSGGNNNSANHSNKRSGEEGSSRFLAGSRNPDSDSFNRTDDKGPSKAFNASVDANAENVFSWALVSQLIRNRSYNKAIILLQNFLDLNAGSARAWAMLAQIYDKQNLTQNAIDAWLNYIKYDNDSNQTVPVIDSIKERFLSMLTGTLRSVGDIPWMIETLNQLVDIRSNDGELHWMLASLYLEREDDYQAQYHALMAANDPVAQQRAEDILSQLNGDVLPEDLNIPLVRYGNQYLVETSIEGNVALLLLDTGASISGVSRTFVNNYSYIVKNTKPIRLNTASGEETSYLFTVDQLLIQSLAFNNHILAVLPMSEQTEFDGLLGVDILGRFDFVIDQDALLLRLKPRN